MELDGAKKVIAADVKHVDTLAKVLGVDRRTVYLKRKKRPPKSVTPEEMSGNRAVEAVISLEQSVSHDMIQTSKASQPTKDELNLTNEFSENQKDG